MNRTHFESASVSPEPNELGTSKMPTLTPEQLVGDFENERDAENKKCVRAQGGVFISAYNPRHTMAVDEERRHEAREHMRKWAATWWEAHGYRMIIVNEATDAIAVDPLPRAGEQKNAGDSLRSPQI